MLVVLAATVACTPEPAAKPSTHSGPAARPEERRATAEALLDAVHGVSGVPALSASVVVGDSVLWEAAAGFAAPTARLPASPATQYRLASVSKLFTVAALLALAERGALDLDVPVSTYVPEWRRPGRPPITVRQLAAHTAGINHYETWDSAAHDPSRAVARASDGVRLFVEAPFLSEPGEAYRYSSFGYVLLAAVVEAVHQAPFSRALEELVLHPLGLEHTRLELGTTPAPGDAEIFRVEGRQASPVDAESQSAFQGATGVQSTATDVARFVAAFLEGEHVSDSLVAAALRPARLASGEPVALGRYSVGIGWRIGEDWRGERVVHHAGSTRGARSLALGYPGRAAAVALLGSASWTSRIETTGELLAAPLLEDSFPDPASCPIGTWRVEGTLEDAAERGVLHVRREESLCLGQLTSDGELRDRFPLDGEGFELVRVARSGEAHVFALAYPWGLAPIRVMPTGGDVRVEGDIVGWPLDLESRGP